MSDSFTRFTSGLLVICMTAMPLQLQAGPIGTAEIVSATQAQGARDTLRGAVERAAAAGKLQAWGITPQQARERIAALTDQEAAGLLARAERAPAGANGAGIGLLIILVFLLWRFVLEPAWNPDTKKEGGKKK